MPTALNHPAPGASPPPVTFDFFGIAGEAHLLLNKWV